MLWLKMFIRAVKSGGVRGEPRSRQQAIGEKKKGLKS
jgi:hypothetical protein